MRTSAILLTSLLSMSLSYASAQSDFLTSKVRVSTETGYLVSDNSYAIIKLNTHSHEFNMSSCIVFTINDTITGKSEQKSLTLNFTGQFPIDNLAFYDAVNDRNIHVVNGELAVNDVVKPYKIAFGLHNPSSINNVDSQDRTSYPLRINFAMEIRTAFFDLHDIPAYYAKIFLIAVKDGVINRSDEYVINPECIGRN